MADIIFTDNSKLTIDEMKKAVARGLEACGMNAEGYAKKDCPVDTGRLRNSIAHKVVEDESAVYIGTNVEYAPYVELGARGRKPKHFLKNAAENHTNEYKSIIEASLKAN